MASRASSMRSSVASRFAFSSTPFSLTNGAVNVSSPRTARMRARWLAPGDATSSGQASRLALVGSQ